MAALTTMALVGASVLGTVGAAAQQRRARKDQERAIREQEEAARIAAANAAALQDQDTSVADITLGRGDGQASQTTGTLTSSAGAAVQTGSVASRVGGLNRRASSGVGL